MTRLLLLTLLALGLAACGDAATGDDAPADTAADEETIPFRRDGRLAFVREADTLVAIDIEIAATDSARTRGLMQRTGLPEQSGMLFIFPFAEPQSFWMANTPLALDLFFVGPDSQIVDVAKYARPFSPNPIATQQPSRFVVEVPAGFADRYGIIASDRVRWAEDE